MKKMIKLSASILLLSMAAVPLTSSLAASCDAPTNFKGSVVIDATYPRSMAYLSAETDNPINTIAFFDQSYNMIGAGKAYNEAQNLQKEMRDMKVSDRVTFYARALCPNGGQSDEVKITVTPVIH